VEGWSLQIVTKKVHIYRLKGSNVLFQIVYKKGYDGNDFKIFGRGVI
jgi:hypothetical protein